MRSTACHSSFMSSNDHAFILVSLHVIGLYDQNSGFGLVMDLFFCKKPAAHVPPIPPQQKIPPFSQHVCKKTRPAKTDIFGAPFYPDGRAARGDCNASFPL